MKSKKWKLPKTLDICALSYQITPIKKAVPLTKTFDRGAYVDFAKHKIGIHVTPTIEEQQLYLLHEMCHIILRSIAETLTMEDNLYLNESFVDLLSKHLYEALKQAKLIQPSS